MASRSYISNEDDLPLLPAIRSPSISPISSPESPLSTGWDQIPQREYISFVLVFPFAGDKLAAEAHVKASLKRLEEHHQHFVARLTVDPHDTHVSMENHLHYEIPFRVVDHGDKMPYTYDELKAKEFTPSAFVHPDFTADGTLKVFSQLPVSQVQLSFIEGGLLLWVYLHHTIADGDGVQNFLECFAAATRGEKSGHTTNYIVDFLSEGLPNNARGDSPAYSGSGASSPASFDALLSDRHEHAVAPSFTQQWYADEAVRGPVRKGNMFVFRESSLILPKSLTQGDFAPAKRPGLFREDHINKSAGETAKNPPLSATEEPLHKPFQCSSYEALAALIWAHATCARIYTGQDDPEAVGRRRGPARLLVYLDRQSRAHPPAAAGGRGSAWLCAGVDMPSAAAKPVDIVAACRDLRHLLPLVSAIRASVDTTGASSNSRIAPLDVDVSRPHHLVINNWRSIGTGTTWNVPGLQAPDPTAIRAIRGGTALGYVHILPKRVDSKFVEMVVYLPEKAMRALMEDFDFMKWVHHVVE